MDKFLHHQLSAHCRKYATAYLACSWLLGLVSGIFAANGTTSHFDLPDTLFQAPEPVTLLSVMLLPVLVSVLFVCAGKSALLLAVCFLKAFSFAYVSRVVTAGFGTAGWLIQFLAMFSDCMSLPVLWLFWRRLIARPQHSILRLSTDAVLTTLVIGIMDCHFISPFLTALQISQKG